MEQKLARNKNMFRKETNGSSGKKIRKKDKIKKYHETN